jgi:dienelactone hydrolase
MTPINFDSDGIAVSGELYTPSVSATGDAIVVVHGSDGMSEPWGHAIREYARELAEGGRTVLIPNYFEKTATVPGMQAFSQASNLPLWTEAINDACAYLKTVGGVSPKAAGLLGFSLGGYICLRLRGSARAIVEFFAPELRAFGGIGVATGGQTPPVQIHHGLADVLVPFAESEAIASVLKTEGIEVQLFSYESAVHGFAGADAANATANRVSKDRTLAFFDRVMPRR